jgi:hypothetical protein
MSLRKRGPVWWVDFVAPDGERIRRSAETGNKVQGQELHDKLKSEVWRLQRLGDRPRRIWQDELCVGSTSKATRRRTRGTRRNCVGSINIWPVESWKASTEH